LSGRADLLAMTSIRERGKLYKGSTRNRVFYGGGNQFDIQMEVLIRRSGATSLPNDDIFTLALVRIRQEIKTNSSSLSVACFV